MVMKNTGRCIVSNAPERQTRRQANNHAKGYQTKHSHGLSSSLTENAILTPGEMLRADQQAHNEDSLTWTPDGDPTSAPQDSQTTRMSQGHVQPPRPFARLARQKTRQLLPTAEL